MRRMVSASASDHADEETAVLDGAELTRLEETQHVQLGERLASSQAAHDVGDLGGRGGEVHGGADELSDFLLDEAVGRAVGAVEEVDGLLESHLLSGGEGGSVGSLRLEGGGGGHQLDDDDAVLDATGA